MIGAGTQMQTQNLDPSGIYLGALVGCAPGATRSWQGVKAQVSPPVSTARPSVCLLNPGDSSGSVT